MKPKVGTVISNKGDKTIIVLVSRLKKHPKYHKRFQISKKYKVHDGENKYKVGDKVGFIDCAPKSRDKRHRVIEIK